MRVAVATTEISDTLRPPRALGIRGKRPPKLRARSGAASAPCLSIRNRKPHAVPPPRRIQHEARPSCARRPLRHRYRWATGRGLPPGANLIVYVVSSDPTGLAAVLGPFRQRHGRAVELRFSRRVPQWPSGSEPVVMILDLANPPPGLAPPLPGVTSRCSYIVLARTSQAVALPWVNFLRSDSARLLTLRDGEPEPLARFVSLLERYADGINPTQVVRAVLQLVPQLGGAEDLVQVILEHPWDVRRPRDLRTYACCREATVRRHCDSLGLKRSEHLITLVRAAALEYLTAGGRMTAHRARLLVGIADPSNFRRQARRAAYFRHPAPDETG